MAGGQLGQVRDWQHACLLGGSIAGGQWWSCASPAACALVGRDRCSGVRAPCNGRANLQLPRHSPPAAMLPRVSMPMSTDSAQRSDMVGHNTDPNHHTHLISSSTVSMFSLVSSSPWFSSITCSTSRMSCRGDTHWQCFSSWERQANSRQLASAAPAPPPGRPCSWGKGRATAPHGNHQKLGQTELDAVPATATHTLNRCLGTSVLQSVPPTVAGWCPLG